MSLKVSQLSTSNIELASIIRNNLAGGKLPPAFAKLYSQFTRLSANQSGLLQWREDEVDQRLNDALRILEAGFIERESNIQTWHDSVRRAAELFEWVSTPQLRPDGIPTQLYSASLYQIAGYPARASGILANPLSERDETISPILTTLLKADFPKLLEELSSYWPKSITSRESLMIPWQDSISLSENLNEWLFYELTSSLGTICSAMRWDDEERLSLALNKLKISSKIFLHGHDIHSGLLSVLVNETIISYTNSTLRRFLKDMIQQVDLNGQAAFERYLRQAYQSQRSLAWPSQVRGIERLITKKSFALCTPTGSGKTTVAEIAILQSLFEKQLKSGVQNENESAPLVIYLVPSKALATEVEDRLSRVLRNLEREPVIIVTGLYGGTDWGPTDAWVTSDDRTILICTYEKAEALIRFLGPLFINRIKLVIIDEAHSVNFSGQVADLQSGESRSLRLEALCMRLLSYIDETQGRAIALSAAASGSEQALASWVTGNSDEIPETTNYRSTRQLVGRLECKPDRRFEIRYDLLDSSDLTFKNGESSEKPFIADPFTAYPPIKATSEGVEVRLRPYLFWAAMNFASLDVYGFRHSVLISLTQNISTIAKYFINLLENDWKDVQLPSFFEEPTDVGKKELWKQCLASCKDYFSESSYEYKLLQRGIVVHHGKMPGLMARLLTRVVRDKIAHVVTATSTLTEGVNLPFETILIPTLRRKNKSMNISEFRNLVGRAGRPGVNTEGKSLVLLSTEPQPTDGKEERFSIRNARNQYESLIRLMQNQAGNVTPNTTKSPMAQLIRTLWENWKVISGSESPDEFYTWLEQTAPTEILPEQLEQTNQKNVIELLDSVDIIILSAIVEIEQVVKKDISLEDLEQKLINLWRRTLAYFSEKEEKQLGDFFVRRGKALLRVYPSAQHRRRLYCTSVPPRAGSLMLEGVPNIIDHLKTGVDYALWNESTKYEYIRKIVELINKFPKFSLATPSRDTSWDELLQWWLKTSNVIKKPTLDKISQWFDYVSKNFTYRFNWGLGSVIALIINEANYGELNEFHLDDWIKTELPWIVIWVKELIIWGTLDPVAAYLLSQNMEITRTDAEKAASIYYADNANSQDANSLLDPRNIRNWASHSLKAKRSSAANAPPNTISVTLTRDFTNKTKTMWRVLPVIEEKEKILWFDPAGFILAESIIPEDWDRTYFENFDFQLHSSQRIISWTPYL